VHLGLFPIVRYSLWECENALPRSRQSAKQIKLERENRKKALAAGGRRACEKLGMPITSDRARLKIRGAGLNLNQDNHSRSNGDRRGGMQQNTKGAMVGIGVYRMHVRNLHHG
jgi:hypothetical protein